MSCGSIYKIVFPNGKHYIGLTTTSLEQRTKEHKKSANNGSTHIVHKAIKKYEVVDTFELVEIDTADTKEELCEKEIRYITEYNSYYMNGKGYNMTYGGEGRNGYVFTEESKQKMSKSAIKRCANPEAREQMSKQMKKFHENNPDAKKEHGERMKELYAKPEARERLRKAQTKRFENPEARQQLSKLAFKRFENPEAREQLSKSAIKRLANPEVREQMSERMKKFHENNPDAGKQKGERRRKRLKENPEERRKQATRGGKKPFDVFTMNGTFIETFTYQFQAIEYLQTNYDITSIISISKVLTGKMYSSAGFVFKYK